MPGPTLPTNTNSFSSRTAISPVVGSKTTAEHDALKADPDPSCASAQEHSGYSSQDAIMKGQYDLNQLAYPCHENDGASVAGVGHELHTLLDAAFDDSSDTQEFDPQWFSVPSTSDIDKTSLSLGRAVDNYRKHKQQEDRDCAMSFPALSTEEAIQFLEQSISRIDTQTRCNTSGSTVTGVIVTRTGDVVTAHLGDSPVSAVIIGRDGVLKQVLKLTEDHKPAMELMPGIARDGTAFHDFDGRRFVRGVGSISMTRALGDRPFGGALNHQAEIRTHRIQEQLTPGDRLLLLITTDGAHNEIMGITHAQHAQTIQRGLMENLPLKTIARTISNDSADIRDNVTVLLLEVGVGKGALLGVFDGHSGSQTSQQACSLLEQYGTEFARKSQSFLSS